MTKAKALFIDDDETILKMFRLALGRADFEVCTASDGEAGVTLFKNEKPDIVVVDIAMPGIDGYEVIEKIRAVSPDEKRIPIIILTAHEQNVMRDYAEELGASMYMTKPIAPSKLIDNMRSLLEADSKPSESV